MVSILWAAKRGQEDGWLSIVGARAVVKAARRIRWAERTKIKLMEESVLTEREFDSLNLFLADSRNDLKAIDAKQCISIVRTLHLADPTFDHTEHLK